MAAARLDLFQISAEGEVQLHRGARISLGYRQPIATARIPSTQEIIGAEGDLFLMVTDGFTDQPGGSGERALGLGHRRLGTWVAELAGMSASQALVLLQQRLHEWQGKQVRRDDVTLLAFTL
jgi:serine phosphatase RsbU (regulator of sigma subunit)